MKSALGLILGSALLLLSGCTAGPTRSGLDRIREKGKGKATFETAENLFMAGWFDEAEALVLTLPVSDKTSYRRDFLLARIAFLKGDLPAAEGLFLSARTRAPDKTGRYWCEYALALIAFHENRSPVADDLFTAFPAGWPVPKEMTFLRSAAGRTPNRIDWNGRSEARLPLVNTEDGELPRVTLIINGVPETFMIDTGGEMLGLSRDFAGRLGIKPAGEGESGSYAGGNKADVLPAWVDSVKAGGVEIRDVPVVIHPMNESVIGTGFLMQFLSTVDFSRRELVLRPRGGQGRVAFDEALPAGQSVSVIPFRFWLTHLILIPGSLNGRDGYLWLFDSGLEDSERGSAVAFPDVTLREAGIPLPKKIREKGQTGAGYTEMAIGAFTADSVGFGPFEQESVAGLSGVFPKELYASTGLLIDGIVSHNYIRRYSGFTLDFDRRELVVLY
jgi:hypothetical protein